MRKYKIMSRTNKPITNDIWYEDTPFLPALNVYESDDTPRDTGLVDVRGCSIYSYQDREPIGFTNRLVSYD